MTAEGRAHHSIERVEEKAHHAAERVSERWYRQPKWWREIIFVGVLYGCYSMARNAHNPIASQEIADRHAADIVRIENALHIFNEKAIQDAFIEHIWFIKILDFLYGTIHFIAPVALLLFLFFKRPANYHKWRNVIMATTFFALIGYTVYPLAPPRFLPEHYGFVDTINTIGGGLNYKAGAVQEVSNQNAAMPSLHTGWSTWVGVTLFMIVRNWWVRAVAIFYPCLIIMIIIVTGNHYWMDVFGGWLVFGLGLLLATFIERRDIRIHHKQSESNADIETLSTT